MALLLTLVILLKPLWPLAEYLIYYDYIVENLCENKDEPMLNCDGKCYLAKMLAAESSQSHHTDNPFEKSTKADKDFKLLSRTHWPLVSLFYLWDMSVVPYISLPYSHPFLALVSPPPDLYI